LRYPVIEITTAIGFLIVWRHFCSFEYICSQNIPITLFYFLIFTLSLILLVIDWENQFLPDKMIFLLFILAVLMLLFNGNTDIFAHLLTGFLLSSVLLILNLFTKGRGMGLGDVKLALALGVFFTLNYGLVWMFSAFLTGAIAGIILILSRKADLKTKVAFGPFLIVSFWFVILWGERLIEYLEIG
jgi:leader peptidase (prepilin peptidase)/N-methyltransferase